MSKLYGCVILLAQKFREGSTLQTVQTEDEKLPFGHPDGIRKAALHYDRLELIHRLGLRRSSDYYYTLAEVGLPILAPYDIPLLFTKSIDFA